MGALLSIVVARDGASRQAPIERLRADIERTAAGINASWGIFIHCLETGEQVAIGADEEMETMSVIKIPIMVEVFAQEREGRLSLDARHTLRDGETVAGGGILAYLDPGATVSVRDLVTLMIVVSDNTAADVLLRLVGGPEAVNRRMAGYGFPRTRLPQPIGAWFDARRFTRSAEQFYREGSHRYGLSTPREMAELLARMEGGTLVDARASQEMLGILRRQFYRSRIPRDLSGYTVAHKSGTFPPFVAADVGVLEAPGRTVVVSIFAMDHSGPLHALDDAMATIARQAGDYFAYRSDLRGGAVEPGAAPDSLWSD